MRTIRTAFATILTALAFVAFESGADAQARRGESRSSGGTSKTTSRNSSVTGTKPGNSKPSSAVTRQSGTANRQPGTVKPSGTVERKPSATRLTTTPSNDRKPSTTVTRPAAEKAAGKDKPSGNISSPVKPDNNKATRPERPSNATSAGKPSVRPDAGRTDRPSARPDAGRPSRPDKPVQVRPGHKPNVPKVHPHDRDFIGYDRPSHFWTGHNHCYGHRVKILPSHVRRHVYHGITYYCYNDIWYRPYGGYYVVCRPPFGTVLAANLISDMTWAAVRLSYYNTVLNTYSKISENNAYIAEQNALIAQNNATIAAQNQSIAMNQQLASQAYGLANELGLIQSYAAAGTSYYYQDGVFYSMDALGQYKVIVPPAGALVESLPEDYELVTLKGEEYYKVDDTVYRVVINEGKPYFEVLGQLYV